MTRAGWILAVGFVAAHAPLEVHAQETPTRGFWGGVGVGRVSDGSAAGQTSDRNPLTASLWYPTGSITFGYFANYVGGHAFLSAGGVLGDNTSGHLEEMGIGGDAQISGPMFSAGLRADLGIAHMSYRCRACGIDAEMGALSLSPAVYIDVNLEEMRWSLRAHGGPHWKWIFGESDHPGGRAASPQVGSAFGLMLIRRF